MAFRGKETIKTKIVIKHQIVEQVSRFNYLRNNIGYDENYDINVNLGKLQAISGPINRIFKNKVRQETKLKVLQIYGGSYTLLRV